MLIKYKQLFVLIYFLLLSSIVAQEPFFLDVYKFKKTENQFDIHIIISYDFDKDQGFFNSLISDKPTVAFLKIFSGDQLIINRRKEFVITEMLNSRNLFDIVSEKLDAKQYTVKFTIEKENSIGQIRDIIEISKNIDISPDYEGDTFYVSDILLADELDYFRENADSAIYKFDDLYINPTVNNNYVAGVNNAMFVYLEIFDNEASNQNANISYSIYRQSGELVNKVEANQLIGDKSSRFYKFYNVAAKLGSGSFIIKVEINYRNLTKYIEKMFTVAIPAKKLTLLKYQIPIEKQIVRYLLNPTGKKFLKTLSDSKIIDFMNQFWIRKAKLEGKTVEELRNQLDKEIEYIKQYSPKDQYYIFGDFAAIIIQYGIPIFIERRTESSTSLSYIEVTYNDSKRSVEGSEVKYYFADINQNGRLVLVHSTDKYYLQDPNWQKRLRRISK